MQRIISTKQDGNCLFRCFAFALYHNTNLHENMRKLAIAQIKKNQNFFKDFVEDFDEYIARKAKTGTWGDHIEIVALHQALQIPVFIYEVNQKNNDSKLILQLEEQNNQNPAIYLQRINQNHYNLLVKNNQCYKLPNETKDFLDHCTQQLS